MKKSVILFLVLCPLFTQAQQFEWVRRFGGNNTHSGESIALDAQSNVYSTGEFMGTSDFDPGSGVYNLSTAGSYDVFITKTTTSGNFVWAKRIGGAGVDNGKCIRTDAAGNVYITGFFTGTVDFNPASGSGAIYNLTAPGSNGIFVLKLDTDGNFVWAKNMEGSGFGRGEHLALDNAGNLYVTGSYSGNLDFDPGAGTFSITGGGGFVTKLDAAGNFVWTKTLEGGVTPNALDIDNAGHVFITGGFIGTVDFDPGAGTFPLSSVGNADSSDAFIAKWNDNGTFVWTRQIGGTSKSEGKSLAVDSYGNAFMGGNFSGTIDADPGAASFAMTSWDGAAFPDVMIIKLNDAGNLLWTKQISGPNIQINTDLALDAQSNVYTTGSYQVNADFDPGPGTYTLSGSYDRHYLLKLTSSGNFVWANHLENSSVSSGNALVLDNQANVYALGFYSSNPDFDPGTGTFNMPASNTDIFILKLGQTPCSNLSYEVDSISDLTCQQPGFIAVHAESGTAPFSYAWNTSPQTLDSTLVISTPGLYQITTSDALACSQVTTFIINGPSTPTGFDLNANLVAGIFRSGLPTTLQLDGFNDGCQPASGSLKLVLDDLLTYSGATPPPDAVSGDTLIWNFQNLVFGSSHVTPQVMVTTPSSVPTGSSIDLSVYITPVSGDSDTTNNLKSYTYTVVNSYDPNDKQVYPKGECIPGYVVNDQLLTYTVRFQNTGNADAINIHVIDSLSPALDLNTVRIIGKSHPMYTEVLPGNVLNFIFNDIYLPDSAGNEAESHGYVIYEVMPHANLPLGTTIENHAAIYFDFNPAIITNSVTNTIADSNLGASASNFTQQACESYTLNGQTYQATGTYQQVFQNVSGCDSTVILHLTIFHPDSSQWVQTACGSYTFNGQTYTTGGTYTQAFTNAHGCDSTVTLSLSIHTPTSSSLTESACESYTLNGQTYTQSGTYTQTYNNANGCDSTITLSLTIREPGDSLLLEEACKSYTLNGQTYTQSGTYQQTFTTSTGCDSLVTLSLVIHQPDTSVTQNGFTLTSDASGTTYQWVDCDNGHTPITGAMEATYSPTVEGNYAVVVTQNGCSDTSACYGVWGMGVTKNDADPDIRLYPNPAGDFLTLFSQNGLEGSLLNMVDLTGKCLQRMNGPAGQTFTMEVSLYSPGIYLLEIIQNGQIHRIKWVKQ